MSGADSRKLMIMGSKLLTHLFTSKIKTFQKDRKVTYGSCACDYRPLKDEKWRVRLVVGVDKLPYELDAGSPAASILETKNITNSVISDAGKGARFLYDT